MKNKKTIIEIYPECEKQEWIQKGEWCHCRGEGKDRFTIQEVGKNAAFLLKENGSSQGWESFAKLHRG